MKAYGLSQDSLRELNDLFAKHLGDIADAKIWLFGSRAKGNYKKNSDIDLAISSRSKKIAPRITNLRLDLEDSNIPYLVDLVYWPELATSFLPEVKKTRLPFWNPKMIERRSIWRICPLGEHWVRRHVRARTPGPIEDVDGHCRKNPSGKDWLKFDEIQMIPTLTHFKMALKPSGHDMGFGEAGTKYDEIIGGWVAYWNDILDEKAKLHPDWIKILIATESSFRPLAYNAAQKSKVGLAIGLGQLTEETWKILRNPKSELKDHFLDVAFDDLKDPNTNLAAMTRWVFRKRQTARAKLKREPTLKELMLEYKGVLKQNPKHKRVASILQRLHEESKKLSINPDL